MIRLGVNWKKDTVIGEYLRIFSDESVRGQFGAHIKRVLGAEGYLRYPGGSYIQEFPLDLAYSEADYSMPGYPVFYRFISEAGIKVMQQLPTTGYDDTGVIRKIKPPGSSVDWQLVDSIISKSVSMIQWIRANGFFDHVVYWQIGNEEWHSVEGELTYLDFAEIASRYILSIKDLIPPEKLIIAAQPGPRAGSHTWGQDVLKLIKEKGLSGYFKGISLHIYPYFLSRPSFDSPVFNYSEYCLGERVIASFSDEFDNASLMLDSLGFENNVKVHVTEMAIDVAGPQRTDGFYTFENNDKDVSAAIGCGRCLLSIAQKQRFGGAAYYCFMHKYLIAPESYNPTSWSGYTKVDDWGWGQCWYLPFQEGAKKLINTPLLDAWGLLSSFMNGAERCGEIIAGEGLKAYISSTKGSDETRCLFLNATEKYARLNLSGDGPGMVLGTGSLSTRAIPLGDYGDSPIEVVMPRELELTGFVDLLPYSILAASGTDLRLNKEKLVPELVRTSAYGPGGVPLVFGDFYITFEGGKLIPSPDGSIIKNYPLQLVRGLANPSRETASLIVFSISYEDLENWSIGYE